MSERVEAEGDVEPESESESESEPEPEIADEDLPDFDDLDTEELFLEHDVLEPCADEDDLCLTDDVREEWWSHVEAMRDGDRAEQLAAFFDVDSEGVEVNEHNIVYVRYEGRTAGRWESDGALLADLAANELFDGHLPGWNSYPLESKSAVVSGLRAFVERCPTCSGEISLDQERVESCCRSIEVYAVTCNDCEERLLEIQQQSRK